MTSCTLPRPFRSSSCCASSIEFEYEVVPLPVTQLIRWISDEDGLSIQEFPLLTR